MRGIEIKRRFCPILLLLHLCTRAFFYLPELYVKIGRCSLVGLISTGKARLNYRTTATQTSCKRSINWSPPCAQTNRYVRTLTPHDGSAFSPSMSCCHRYAYTINSIHLRTWTLLFQTAHKLNAQSTKTQTYLDRPARRISSVLKRFTAMTELSSAHILAIYLDQDLPRMQHLPLDPVVVPDTLRHRVHRFTRSQIQSNRVLRLLCFLLQSHNSILNIKSTVRGESLRNDEHGLSECENTELGTAFGCLESGLKVSGTSDFESSCSGNEALVLDSILDRSETVS